MLASLSLLLALAASSVAVPVSAVDSNYQLTFYSYGDNDPPGNNTAIKCGGRNGHANGIGTFTEPLTMALAPGVIGDCEVVYSPFLKKYLRNEDECATCSGKWIDVWLGPFNLNAGPAVDECQSTLTMHMGFYHNLIRNPAANLEVVSALLFDTKCHPEYVYEANDASYSPKSSSIGALPSSSPIRSPSANAVASSSYAAASSSILASSSAASPSPVPASSSFIASSSKSPSSSANIPSAAASSSVPSSSVPSSSAAASSSAAVSSSSKAASSSAAASSLALIGSSQIPSNSITTSSSKTSSSALLSSSLIDGSSLVASTLASASTAVSSSNRGSSSVKATSVPASSSASSSSTPSASISTSLLSPSRKPSSLASSAFISASISSISPSSTLSGDSTKSSFSAIVILQSSALASAQPSSVKASSAKPSSILQPTSSRAAAPSIRPSQRPIISPDGTCGGLHGFTCTKSQFGDCCSQYGWCGDSRAYCKIERGCNSKFGTCWGTSDSHNEAEDHTHGSENAKGDDGGDRGGSSLNISPDGTCGPSTGFTCQGSSSGSCCSQYGWCGSSKAYCRESRGCQSEYGVCT